MDGEAAPSTEEPTPLEKLMTPVWEYSVFFFIIINSSISHFESQVDFRAKLLSSLW